LGIALCKITASTKAEPDAKAIAPEAEELRVAMGNFLQTIGHERFCGVVNIWA